MDEKVVVVVGASRGIGKATAELFAERGARVMTFARKNAMVIGDASQERDIDRLFSECEKTLGPCEILINCAGIIDPEPLMKTSVERWDRMFEVNVRATYLACRRALPRMIERHSGAIVNVASISGVPGPEKFPGFVSYCASKAAVIGLTEALAVEVKGEGIRVNCVSPGSVDTEMWAKASGGAPASMTAAEVAKTILFLASDDSRPINGQNLNVYSS